MALQTHKPTENNQTTRVATPKHQTVSLSGEIGEFLLKKNNNSLANQNTS